MARRCQLSTASPDSERAAEEISDRNLLRAWTDHLMGEPHDLPISFCYDGAAISGIPRGWSPTSQLRTTGPARLERVVEAQDPSTGLGIRVEIAEYSGFPVLEWTVWLTNHSDSPTPVIEDLLALDACFGGGVSTLAHGNGDFYSRDGYAWSSTRLAGSESVDLSPNGGRPCDGAFPYFRLNFPGGGLTLAIGWPGQWRVRFQPDEDGVGIQAGQEQTHLRLLPGEAIRTPRVTLMAWSGNQGRAVNLWRRWFREHVMPRPSGRRLKPLLNLAATDEGEEFTGATEANQVEYQRRYQELGMPYDVWWIDAGWYPCLDGDQRRWTRTGTWKPDPDRFPDGLASVSKTADAVGAALLLWFEPERVTPGTEIWDDHPQWVLKNPDVDYGDEQAPPHARSGLLDLSNQECRAWLTDLVSGMITKNGIGIYRQDFNFAPLAFWRGKDDADRQGMTENLHVQGYLAFWDALLERHPDLLIDSCASGGRRNDLETMRRAVPLHYTDFGYGEAPTKLDFHRTMFEWLPYFRESTQAWDVADARALGIEAAENDRFAFHCALAPMLTPAHDIRSKTADFDTIRSMVQVWRDASEILLDGDYYPLTPAGRTDDEWVAWQFDRPRDLAGRGVPDGFVQAIRLARSADPTLTVALKGLPADASYTIVEAETGESRQLSGAALRDGLEFKLPPRSGSIWLYREQQG